MSEPRISENLRENYSEYYADGDSEWRRLSAVSKVANIIRLCSNLPRESVLEIGAGEGAVLDRLDEIHFSENLFALEISQSGVENINKRGIPSLKECQVYDGYKIPYANEQFDLVIMSHVLEHVEYPRMLLYEASRVAKKLFIEVPLEDINSLPRDFKFTKVGHINMYNPKSIRRLVQSCHLNVLDQITTNPSIETYKFRKGIKGLVSYYIKQGMLTVFPKLAVRQYVYHGALLCEKQSPAK